jgi:hypothetical protein
VCIIIHCMIIIGSRVIIGCMVIVGFRVILVRCELASIINNTNENKIAFVVINSINLTL